MKAAKFGYDSLFLAGAAVFVAGVWMAWRPLGVMVAGVLLAGFGFLLGYGRPRGESE